MSRLRISLAAWRRLMLSAEANQASLRLRSRLGYRCTSAFYSLLNRIQQQSYAEWLREIRPLPPLFVLGFWRSGTSLLHEMLCCDPRFGFPSTYACLNSSHFLLTERWLRAKQPQSTRPMDHMRYSWTSPQEDEFALLALGAPSPYEALLIPSLIRNPRWLLDLGSRSPEDQACWMETFTYFLRLLTVRQQKPLVLKSPPHGFRLPLLAKQFPQARYVIIERNPYEVFASNLKLWQTLFAMYSLEPFSMDEVEAFILAAYPLHEQIVAEGMRDLLPHQVAAVRYESLVGHPMEEMSRIYRELDLQDFESARPRLEQYLAASAGHVRNRLELSPQQTKRIESRWGNLIGAKGYVSP